LGKRRRCRGRICWRQPTCLTPSSLTKRVTLKHGRLTFLGGAQTVTGSKFLLEFPGLKILIDCGLFQGVKELRRQNWDPFPIDPKVIDAVILTHAHLDHVGYLPLLVKQGFTGSVYSTEPTRALANVVLLDASHIQEEEASKAAEGSYSKHERPEPLFTQEDSVRAMGHFRTVEAEEWHKLNAHVRFRLIPSGHILGSAFVELEHQKKRFVFTGDLGRRKPMLYPPPRAILEADYLVVESTYGDRLHPKESPLRLLARILKETIAAGGQVIVPAFAIGRSQEILHLLAQLRRQNQLPKVPIYFDTPMGVEATKIFRSYPVWHRLTGKEATELGQVAEMVTDSKMSQAIAKNRKPKIVIAGSGMITGGRVLHYLERALSDKRNTILLVGFQALGTRGRMIQDGVNEVKIRGNFYSVKAKVESLPGLSAHADQSEIMEWLRHFKRAPRTVFLVHGEPQPADVLRVKIKSVLGWNCVIPRPMEEFELGD